MATTVASKKKEEDRSRFSAATSHRIRVRCLTRMAERPTSPASIGRELGIDASAVSYHVKTLKDLNLVEQVSERPVRGAVEHFYRAVSLTEISGDEWAALPTELRRIWIETALSFYAADLMHSIETGTLLAQEDSEIARTAMKVDQQGWEEVKETYMQAQERVMEIKAQAETRLATDDESQPRPILSFLSLFNMPPVAG